MKVGILNMKIDIILELVRKTITLEQNIDNGAPVALSARNKTSIFNLWINDCIVAYFVTLALPFHSY